VAEETNPKQGPSETLQRRAALVRGVVQGVGFRPFVYRLAQEEGLAGLIGNDTGGVTINGPFTIGGTGFGIMAIIAGSERNYFSRNEAFKAIDKITGVKARLNDYRLEAVTSGKDALGEVSLKLTVKNKTVSGRSSSTDIIEASVRAYLDAVNKIVI